jgi:hypothetical protein
VRALSVLVLERSRAALVAVLVTITARLIATGLVADNADSPARVRRAVIDTDHLFVDDGSSTASPRPGAAGCWGVWPCRGPVDEATTDASGHFTIKALVGGSFQLSAAVLGHAAVTADGVRSGDRVVIALRGVTRR